MAALPTLIWTLLPNGVSADGYRFSLFVSPRLENGGPTLGDYDLPNFAQAVAAMAGAQTAWVQLNSAAAPLIPVTIDTAALRPDLWAALFPPSTPVTGFSYKDNANRPLYSFSVAALENYLEGLYAVTANQSATDFPDLKTGRLRQLADDIGRALPLMREGLQRTQSGSGPHPDAGIEAALDNLGSSIPLKEFYRALRFYKRGNAESWAALGYKSQQDPVVAALVPEPLKPPPFDFHQALTLLGDHPFLLKALGLVIDCKLLFADLGGALPANGRLRAQVQWGPPYPAPSDKTPWTRFEVDAAGFRPEPRKGGDIQAGLLTLGNADRFRVFQTDVDGNALKTLDYAANMNSVLVQLLAIPPGENAPWVPVAQPAPESLPAQRNGGLTLTRIARDEKIYGDFLSQNAINGALDSEVYFDDIARGYRVDVSYGGKWHSLCHRTGSYSFAGAPLAAPAPPPDEGYVKAATATSGPKNKPQPDNPLYLHEAVFGWDNWSLVAPRPGRSISYDRNDTARTQTLAVDRIENKPTPEFPLVPQFSVVDGTLPRLRFGQFYQFRARVVDLAGNGLPAQDGDFPGVFWRTPRIKYLRYEPVPPPVLVLRERVTAGESVEHLVVRSKVTSDDLPDQDTVFNDVCRRFIAPPKTSQILAELHGAFDPFWSDPVKSYELAAKDGTLNDPANDVAVFKYDGTPSGFPSSYKRGDPLEKGTYTVHTDPALALPYLPDPLAIGLAVQGFPGATAIVRQFDGATDWPNFEPFVFDLIKSAGASPELGPLPKFTQIALPKGTMLTLKCSSAITDGGRENLWRWHTFDPAMKTEVTNLKNQHWMITPGRSVTFVHAVEKPLDVPVIQRFSYSKGEGHTFVRFRSSEFACPSHSTGQIELFARWKDKVDRLDEIKPRYEDRAGRIFDAKVGYEEATVHFGDGVPGRAPSHEFGDTKHRMVAYYGVGTTRYREYFPASITSDPSLISVEGPPFEPTPGVEVVNIPSSAHPDVPKVLYILPTFKWVDTPNGRQRVGRGLRIYLDRPWYSSGDGELLGIVVPRAQQPIAEEVRRYISEWGADPLYSSSGPLSPIGFSSFLADPEAPLFAPVLGQNLRLHERSKQDLRVDVIGVAPDFNLDRKVHFVDVTMAPGAAFQPFVRFSLVRYQPSSLPGLHLSRSVRTEFAQLMADRSATFTRGRSGLEVTLSGLASRNSLGEGLPMPDPIPIPTGVGQQRAGLAAPNAGPVTDPGIGLPGPITDPGIQLVKDAYAGAGRLVVASFERHDAPGSDASGSDDLGWKAVPGESILESYKSLITPEYVFWKRTMQLPAGLGSDGKQYRLVIKEYEIFETDPEVSESVPVFNPGGIPLRKRLVYADRFELEP